MAKIKNINKKKNKNTKFQKAWFFKIDIEKGEAGWVEINKEDGIFIFENKKYKLINDEIDLGEKSKNAWSKIIIMIEELSKSFNMENHEILNNIIFKIQNRIRNNAANLEKNPKQFEKYNSIVSSKLMSILNKIQSSLLILMEILEINYQSYNLKKNVIVNQLFLLLEGFGILWYYLYENDYHFVKPRNEDENTLDNWKIFWKEIIVSSGKDSLFQNLKESIEDIELLRRILTHLQSIKDIQNQKVKYYQVDYFQSKNTETNHNKDYLKLGIVLEHQREWNDTPDNFDYLNDLSINHGYEKVVDVYKCLNVIVDFLYEWFLFIFKKAVIF